jgi:hypothetical protein
VLKTDIDFLNQRRQDLLDLKERIELQLGFQTYGGD